MTIRKIVISGYYGFNNAGDEAMLYAILRSLRALYPKADVTVISGKPEETAKTFNVHAIPRFGGFSILKRLIGSDLVISGGGSLLQDVTSSRSLLYYLSIIAAGVLLRKKVFLYGQGIGPLHRKWVCRLLTFVLSHVDAITVRDRKSADFLKRLGVKAPVYTTADSVLSLPKVPTDRGQEILREAGVPQGKRIIGISVRSWMGEGQWICAFRDYVKRISEEPGTAVVFISMQYPEDKKIAEKICEGLSFENIYFLDGSFEAPELMSIIGSLDVLVGMRLHALIFAALMHVPLLGISYDPKIDNFLSDIGQKSAFPISAFHGETLYNKTKELLESPAERDWSRVENLRKQAGETIEILEKTIKN